jgi:hypothetical protein
MGVSPGRYVSRMRLEKAMVDIAAGKLSVVDIALKTGIASKLYNGISSRDRLDGGSISDATKAGPQGGKPPARGSFECARARPVKKIAIARKTAIGGAPTITARLGL